MFCLIIYIYRTNLFAVLPWKIAVILKKLLNAHLCTCCFLKDALGETPRVRQIWTLSALKNKLSHSLWGRHQDNPGVCGLCKHWLCLHGLQKLDYCLFFFFLNMNICWDAFMGCHSYSVELQWPQKCFDTFQNVLMSVQNFKPIGICFLRKITHTFQAKYSISILFKMNK